MRTSHLIFWFPICKIEIKLFAFSPVIWDRSKQSECGFEGSSANLVLMCPVCTEVLAHDVPALKTTLLAPHSSEMQGCGFCLNTSRCCKCSTFARLLSRMLGCWHLVVSDQNKLQRKMMWVRRNSRGFRQKIDFLAATVLLPQGFRTGRGCVWI